MGGRKEMYMKGARERQGRENTKKNERKKNGMRKIKGARKQKRRTIYSEEKR